MWGGSCILLKNVRNASSKAWGQLVLYNIQANWFLGQLIHIWLGWQWSCLPLSKKRLYHAQVRNLPRFFKETNVIKNSLILSRHHRTFALCVAQNQEQMWGPWVSACIYIFQRMWLWCITLGILHQVQRYNIHGDIKLTEKLVSRNIVHDMIKNGSGSFLHLMQMYKAHRSEICLT